MNLPKRSKKRQSEIDSGAYQPPKRKSMKRTAFKKKTIAEMIAEGLVKIRCGKGHCQGLSGYAFSGQVVVIRIATNVEANRRRSGAGASGLIQ